MSNSIQYKVYIIDQYFCSPKLPITPSVGNILFLRVGNKETWFEVKGLAFSNISNVVLVYVNEVDDSIPFYPDEYNQQSPLKVDENGNFHF